MARLELSDAEINLLCEAIDMWIMDHISNNPDATKFSIACGKSLEKVQLRLLDYMVKRRQKREGKKC